MKINREEMIRLMMLSGRYEKGKPLSELTDLHHAGLHNTEAHRMKYPLFIDSPCNLFLCSREFHQKNQSFGHIRKEQAEIYECFLLELHRLINDFGVSRLELYSLVEYVLEL